jgi:3-deoxy-7-phosphoheptulonate synthase
MDRIVPTTHDPSSTATVRLGASEVGNGAFALIAGPCAVEDRQQLLTIARDVGSAGATVLRGGAFKPRTSPYSFQGLGREGLQLLAEAREATGLPIVTELLDVRDSDAVAAVADVIQVGARSMHNAQLLKEIATLGRAVLLKRNPGATIDEFLSAADYLLEAGCNDVVLCERGIRGFEQSTRYTLDISAVPVLRSRTHLPIIVDPSHAAGRSDIVPALAFAAAAAGADGVMVEVHNAPDAALSDGAQSLPLAAFAEFVTSLDAFVATAGKRRSTVAAAALV